MQGRGATAGCPNYLGTPACGAGTAPLLQTNTQGTTGLQQWAFTQASLSPFSVFLFVCLFVMFINFFVLCLFFEGVFGFMLPPLAFL